MAINRIGSIVRIYGTLLVNGTPTDPNTLQLDIIDPAGTTTSYIYGTDQEVVRDSVGQFHFDLQLTQRGEWRFEWYSNSSLTAFEAGTIEVADAVNITTVDDSETPVAVPFVQFRIYDNEGVEVETILDPQRTDATGTAAIELPDNTYRIVPFKLGWVFDPVSFDVAGTGPHAVQLQGRLLATRWLQWEDLERVVDRATVDRLFNDDNSGFRDMVLIEQVILGAEAMAESRLLRSWTRKEIYTLARNDTALRNQAAWIAMEMATERRQEFIASDGKGRFWAQYERAIEYFDALSKSKTHSRGEAKAGKGANAGGERLPQLQRGEAPFIFAPDSKGFGQGGF